MAVGTCTQGFSISTLNQIGRIFRQKVYNGTDQCRVFRAILSYNVNMTDEEAEIFEQRYQNYNSWRAHYFDRIAQRPELLEDLTRLIETRKRSYRKPRELRRRQAAHKRNLKRHVSGVDIMSQSFRVPLKVMLEVAQSEYFVSRPDSKAILRSLRRQLFTGSFSLFDIAMSQLRAGVGSKKLDEETLCKLNDDFDALRDFFGVIEKLNKNRVIQSVDDLHVSSRRLLLMYNLLQSCDTDRLRSVLREFWRREASPLEPISENETQALQSLEAAGTDVKDSQDIDFDSGDATDDSLDDARPLSGHEILILRKTTEPLLDALRDEKIFPYAVFHRWSFGHVSTIFPETLRIYSPPDQVIFEFSNGLAYLTAFKSDLNLLRNIHDDVDLVKAIYGKITEFTHTNAWQTLAAHVAKCLSITWVQIDSMPALTLTRALNMSQIPDLPAGGVLIEIVFNVENVFGHCATVSIYYSPRLLLKAEAGLQ